MDEKVAQQLFDELLPSLEALDTKCAALRQFLMDKGIANEAELAPYFEQAANASSVRWRAARVRINHLLSTPKAEENAAETPAAKTSEKVFEPAADKSPATVRGQSETDSPEQKSSGDTKAAEGIAANAVNERNKQGQEHSQSGQQVEKDAA
jgi:uncharacterized protein YcaQ